MTSLSFRAFPIVVVGSIGLALLACGSGSSRAFDDGSSSSSSSSGGSTSSSGFIPADGGPTPNQEGCSDAAKLVYVLSLEGDVYSFAPADKKFTKIGPLNCGGGGGFSQLVPISMAVDRDAIAWVNIRDQFSLDPNGPDQLYKFDTKTGTCSPSQIKGGMGGMGFSIDKGTTDKETLFVAGAGSSPTKFGIKKVDFQAQKLVDIGDLPEAVDLELTGTGDGRLFGFLIDKPLAITEIDKTALTFSGRHDLPTVETPQAPMFAFSFWGGDFYIYTATEQTAAKTTTVSRYRPSDGSVDTGYMTNIGFHIVGAGVSTCAPTVSPN